MSEVKRYVPRILRDDGMIPFAEVAHYTHLNLIQYVSVADHDAALRRAKAEVLREVKYEALGSRIKCFKSDTLYAEGNDDALNALVKWIDARAAQIEEGE